MRSSRNLSVLLICSAVFLFALFLHPVETGATASEGAGDALKLSMASAVQMALQSNPVVILQDFAVSEAELDLKAAQINLRVTVTPQQLENVQAALEAAKATAQLTRQAQGLAAREHYISALKAQHTLTLTSSAVEQAERHLSLVRERLSAGLATDTDLYQAESNLRRAEITHRQAESSLESSHIKLNQLLSRDLKAPLELVDDISYEVPLWELERDTQQAISTRLDIQVLQRSLELAKRNLAAADPRFTPQAQIERLTMDVERAQIALDQATTRVILETRDAILGLETARIAVELAEYALEHQQKELQVATLRHDSGLITTSELLDTQAAVNIAEVQAVQAVYDLALAITRYLNAIGSEAVPVAQE